MPNNRIDYFGKTLIDLSDIDATPDKVLKGVTFRDKTGALQTGAIRSISIHQIVTSGLEENGLECIVKAKFKKNIYFPVNGEVRVFVPKTNFGDATPADVAEGKTFTSASGLKTSGTAKLGGGGLPDVITPGDTPILGDFSGKLITNKNVFEDSNILLIIPKTGKYRFYVSATAQGYDYSGNKPLISIRKNGVEISQQQVESDNFNAVKIEADCNANDQITVWGRAIGTYSTVTVDVISAVACIDWTIPV